MPSTLFDCSFTTMGRILQRVPVLGIEEFGTGYTILVHVEFVHSNPDGASYHAL